MSTWLSTEDLHLLELRHKTERDKRIADRIKAVLLLHKGFLHKEIAEALFISPERLSRHIEEYQTEAKLSPSNGGSSSNVLDIYAIGIKMQDFSVFKRAK